VADEMEPKDIQAVDQDSVMPLREAARWGGSVRVRVRGVGNKMVVGR
jgi:hypothetical protein